MQRQIQWQRQIRLESTFKEQPYRLVTFETFDQSDEETWPDQQKYNDKYKDNDRDSDKDNPRDRVAKCQILYTEQIFQTKVLPHETCVKRDKFNT